MGAKKTAGVQGENAAKKYKKSVALGRITIFYPPEKHREFIVGMAAIKGESMASIVSDIVKKHIDALPPHEVDRVRKSAHSKHSY